MGKITVVDAPMGRGKTSWAIQYMNNLGEDSFRDRVIYITPYLDEVKRVKESVTTIDLIEPELKYDDGKSTKLTHLKELLDVRADIISTHAMFKNIDDEIIDLLSSRGYILILDEVFQVIENIKIKKNDLKLLLNSEWIVPVEGDNKGLHKWNYGVAPNEETDFAYIKTYADTKNLYIFNSTALYWTFPANVFKLFRNVYILTYLFEAQIQSYYYKLHNIEYATATIDHIDGKYELIQCSNGYDLEFRAKIKQLINIYEGDLNTNYLPKRCHKEKERTYLSSSWFKKRDRNSVKEKNILKNNMDNYFRNICNAKSDNRLWTTYKASIDDLKGRRYSKQFLSFTTRATNQYRYINNMAFMLNLFMNPNEVNYFIDQNVNVNEDLLAISDMLQWIFRSSIRDDKPINIYIPSFRMRNLLEKWLNNEL